MVTWLFYLNYLKKDIYRMVFKFSEIYLFFSQKRYSVTTPGGRHITGKTFIKLLIDFFIRGKMFYTHFLALFNSKHYAEVRNKRTSHLSCGHQSLREHSWTFLLLLCIECSESCCLSSNLNCNAFSSQWRLARCQKVLSFPYSPNVDRNLCFMSPEKVEGTKISLNSDFITSLTCSLLCFERIQCKN